MLLTLDHPMARWPDHPITRCPRLSLTDGRSWLILRRNHTQPLRVLVRQIAGRERAVAVPPSKPFRSGNIPEAWDRDPRTEITGTPFGASGDLPINDMPTNDMPINDDTNAVLSLLEDLVATGDYHLDPILGTVTDVARQLTGASGAALAMWKEGAMVCRARSGDVAPMLGAQLNANTGISGECLRTAKIQHCTDTENNPLVDLEVCRSLGLRSIVVLPIRGWRGISGILEVFSTHPEAFTEEHVAYLQKLAKLVERARTRQSDGAAPAAVEDSSELEAWSAIEKSAPEAPASGRSGRAETASRRRSRPFILSAIGVVAIALLALILMTWRARRAPQRPDGQQIAAPNSPSPVSPANSVPSTNPASAEAANEHSSNSEEASKLNPSGTSANPSSTNQLSPAYENLSIGNPVKLASKTDAIAGKRADVAPNVVVRHETPNLHTGMAAGGRNESQANLRAGATVSAEPPPIHENAVSQATLNGVLSAKASLPGLGAPVSQGITGGQLVNRVPPTYPPQAVATRLEGKVVLAAIIMEDGTLRDVKVVEGPPALAQAAVEAVKHWRYRPFKLDGKPVKNEIRVNVDFKLPR